MRLIVTLAILGAGLSVQSAAAADGRGLYMENCAACHRPTGVGVPGAFPTLAGNKVLQGNPKESINRVLQGRGGMPSFQAELTDLQIATILSFTRSAWGNKGQPVSPMMVQAQRSGRRENAKASLQAH